MTDYTQAWQCIGCGKIEAPGNRRQLGRPRSYTRADLPERLLHWHAPRANGTHQ